MLYIICHFYLIYHDAYYFKSKGWRTGNCCESILISEVSQYYEIIYKYYYTMSILHGNLVFKGTTVDDQHLNLESFKFIGL